MAEERVQRRLAAILAADVVGYSRLMRADETGTLTQLKALRKEVFDPRTAEYNGRIVKTTGDGVLVEFPSAVDAVQCAIKVQRALTKRNEDVPLDHRLELRIGINLGDIIVDEDDIYGDGVNVAARLEGLCGAGEVYVSGAIHDQTEGKVAAVFDDLGEQIVKNIDKPFRVYRVSEAAGSSVAAATTRGPNQPLSLPDKPSIAVLPFENLSGDPEQGYFSDGITEDIITDLSKVSGLFVIARNSSFAYKGQSTDVRRVARELGVRSVLEGSVRKAGTRVRINAQLIDAVSGGHLWAERYDGDLDDIFSLQDEITGKIVSALEVYLTEGEKEKKRNLYIPNWEAYECFIHGRYIVTEHYFRFSQQSGEPPSEENLLLGRQQFQRAIELDPGFAGGYAGLSWTYSLGIRHGLSSLPDEDREKAIHLAEQAVEIDKDFGWSHTALVSARLMQRRHEDAISSAKRAVELQPSDADAHAYLGFCLMWAGNPQGALVPLENSLRLDPRYQARSLSFLAFAHFGMQRYADVVSELETAIGPLGNVIHFTLVFLTGAYVQLGRMDEAKATVHKLRNYYSGFTVGTLHRLLPYKDPADTEFLCDALRKAGLPES